MQYLCLQLRHLLRCEPILLLQLRQLLQLRHLLRRQVA